MPRRVGRLAVLVLIILAAVCLAYVPSGHFAVRESLRGEATPLEPGLHLRVPILQRLYRYDSVPVVLDGPIDIVTKDNAGFKLPVTIAARASASDVLTFHRGRAGRETRTYIEERVRDAVLSAARELNADEILQSDAARRMVPGIQADLLTRGIADDGVTIGRPGPQVIFNAVADYLKRRLPASARRLAETGLAAAPDEPLAHAAMGMVLESEGRAAEAEAEYMNSLFLDPAALQPMSRLYVMLQSSSDAAKIARLERLLIAALAKQQESAVHNDWLGQVYLRTGRLDQADKAFHTAIGLAPKDPEFRISLGALRTRERKFDEARAAYEEALALRRDHPLALYDIGVSYAMQGKMDEAIESFHKAERAGPPSVALLNSLAQAYEEKGALDRAADYLRRSLSLRADQSDRKAALRRIETALRKRGRAAAPPPAAPAASAAPAPATR